MKNMKLSLIALVAMGSIGYAGGDFLPVTSYETEDMSMAETVTQEVVEAPRVVVEAPVVAGTVSANGFYAGMGITATQYNTNCNAACINGGTDKSEGVMVRAGYDFNQYVGIEARGLRTDFNLNGGQVKHAGIFVKPMLSVTDETNIYGLVGVAKTTTSGGLQRTDAETLALGAGVEVDLTADTPKEGRYNRTFDGQGDQEKGIGVFIDYERMVVKSAAPDLDAVSAGVTYDF